MNFWNPVAFGKRTLFLSYGLAIDCFFVFRAHFLPLTIRNMSTTPTNTSLPNQKNQGESFDSLKQRIHQKLIGKLDLNRVNELEGEVLKREIRQVVEHLCDSENTLLNRSERDRLVDEVLDETFGLGPLEILLKDASISDILINGPKDIFVERGGKMQRSNVLFRDNAHLVQIIDRIVSKVGRRVDETSPMVDARLEDGSRVNAIIPPLALDGAAMSIRRFGSKTTSSGRPFEIQSIYSRNGHVSRRRYEGPIEHHHFRWYRFR